MSRRAIVALVVCAALCAGTGVALAAFTDSTANSSSFAAAATFPVLSVSIPDVEQTAQVGAQMRVTNGVWSPTPTSFTYGWLRCNTSGASCVAITGATAATYTPVAADVGSTLRGAVTASGGPALSSEATQTVKASSPGGPLVSGGTTVATVAASMPSITGTLQVGQVLTSTTGTWAGATVTITRQWLRCSATGDQCATIAGATGATYTAVTADRNLRLRVRVTATRSGTSNAVLTLDVGPIT